MHSRRLAQTKVNTQRKANDTVSPSSSCATGKHVGCRLETLSKPHSSSDGAATVSYSPTIWVNTIELWWQDDTGGYKWQPIYYMNIWLSGVMAILQKASFILYFEKTFSHFY